MTDEKHLTAGEYFEWRLRIEEMSHAKTRLGIISEKLKTEEIRHAYDKLRLLTQKNTDQNSYSGAISTYESFRDTLGNKYGVEFKNKMIDDTTFEIRDLPEQNQNKEE